MRAMKVVTRGTIASAVHRNSQDIDVLNGVVDKLCLGIFGCSWRVGSWEQGDEEVLKLKLKEVAADQRPRQQLRVVREFWRGKLQLLFGAGVSASLHHHHHRHPVGNGLSCAERRRNIDDRFGDATISKMPHILLNTYLAQLLLPRLVPPSSHVPSPLKPDLSRLKTHTPHVIAVLLLWDNILYANPDPFPCLSYPSPSIAPPVAPGAGSGRPVPNEK